MKHTRRARERRAGDEKEPSERDTAKGMRDCVEKKSKHTKKIWEAMHFSHVLQSRTIQHGITKPEITDTKTCTHTTHRTHKYKANASCLAVYGMEWVSLSEVRWQRRKRNQVLYCKQIESIYATTNSLTDQRELLMQCLPLPLPYTQRHIVCEMKE